MAITALTDVKLYNEQIRNAYAERVAKAINGFFEKARGAFLIRDAAVPGEYLKSSFWKMPSGLVSRRVSAGTGSTATATPITMSQGENVAVKLQRKIGPLEVPRAVLRGIASSIEELQMVVGEMAADSVVEKMVDDALLSLVAALNRAPYLADRTGKTDSQLNAEALAAGLAVMGDRSGDIVCWVMHSKPFFDLINKNTQPALVGDLIVEGVTLYGAQPATFGRPALVIDAASLLLDQTTDHYRTLGLTAGAVELVADTQLADIVHVTKVGSENITEVFQGERDWALRLKGFAWDVSNGAANPDDTALATATNWDAASSSAKDRAGVCIKTT